MAKEADTALPLDKTDPEGDLAPGEKDVPEDDELDVGEFIGKMRFSHRTAIPRMRWQARHILAPTIRRHDDGNGRGH